MPSLSTISYTQCPTRVIRTLGGPLTISSNDTHTGTLDHIAWSEVHGPGLAAVGDQELPTRTASDWFMPSSWSARTVA
jgi:hypothetical protein